MAPVPRRQLSRPSRRSSARAAINAEITVRARGQQSQASDDVDDMEESDSDPILPTRASRRVSSRPATDNTEPESETAQAHPQSSPTSDDDYHSEESSESVPVKPSQASRRSSSRAATTTKLSQARRPPSSASDSTYKSEEATESEKGRVSPPYYRVPLTEDQKAPQPARRQPIKGTRQQRPRANPRQSKAKGRQQSRAVDDTADPEQAPQGSLRLDLPPITNVHQAFYDMLSKRKSDLATIAANGGFQLRVGTICSGTEAPVFALKLIQELSQVLTNGQMFLRYEHLFSVENEPFKQAYISRNAPGSIVFRDVVDLADTEATAAPTILGDHREIPRDIDLLVAGTSCVDFSTLNTGKKDAISTMKTGGKLVDEWKKSKESLRPNFFDDVREWLSSITPAEIQTAGKAIGQSSLTFLSTVCYLQRHRPKMVVLENVNGAPWDSICGFFLRAIDYVATHCAVDTKDYYIPQTRQRGYVVAVDRTVFGSSAKPIIDEWKTQLSSLKRSASSPVQDWLLPSNDPLTMKARQDESEKAIVSGLNPGKDSQWERSKLRHARVRRQLNLGNSRPLTAWGSSGIQRPYDRIDKLVLKGQNDRALDCVEIYYLRSLLAGPDTSGKGNMPPGPLQYDIKFKSQIFDLSQNIDRSQLSRSFGITGCLTPRGLNLITNEGRLVTGFEALNLQGLPLRDLDLTRESQDELRDLAGNAMTTTVVGASLFSLLISVKRHEEDIEKAPLNTIVTEDETIMLYQPLYRANFPNPKAMETSTTALGPLNVQQVIDIAKRSRRYCYCNGGAKYSTAELLQCETCDIFRCTSCAGNPVHRFGDPRPLENPIMNDIAPGEIMKHFPTALTNIIGASIERIPFHPDLDDNALQTLLLDSLRSSTFYYSKVLISEVLTVCYSAKDSNCHYQLKAVISDTCVTWYLFLDPWSPCGQQLCRNLRIPAARMLRPFGRVRISPQDSALIPEQGSWEFWVYTPISFDVNVTELSTTSIRIEDIALDDLPAATHNDLRSISGTYDHHPECDAAEDSLHVCAKLYKRYLFKDPTKIGPTQEDCFVISDECRYLETHEFRDFSVSFPPDWTPRTTGARAKATIGGYWEKPPRTNLHNPRVSHIGQAGCVSIPPHSHLDVDAHGHSIRTLASVRMSSNMFADTYMTLSKYEWVGPKNWAIVSRSDYSALFDLLAPVNVKLGDIETTVHSTETSSCQHCCPELPTVHWMERETDDTKKSLRIREPYRLSSDMRSYEDRLRLCSEPLRVAVNIKDSTKGTSWKEVTANYEVNFDLLVHRAVNHLPKLDQGSEEFVDMKTFASVERGSLNIPNLVFESFRKSLRRLPGRSSKGRIESREVFIDGYALSAQQQVSLTWMLDRELKPEPFTEREIEECRFDPLNLRVLGVAERGISRIGGILADDVGYGKTVVSLALMSAQQSFDRHESQRLRASSNKNTMALAASLVIVPKHLVEQWREEAAKFIGWKGTDVMIINSSRDLHEYLSQIKPSSEASQPPAKRTKLFSDSTTLLDKLRAAKLIILNSSVLDDDYYTWLGKYAGSLAHPQTIPKSNGTTKSGLNPNILGAFQDWYEDATKHAREHLSGFDTAVFNPSQFKTIQRRQQDLQETWESVVADYYDDKTRLGLQAIRKDKTGQLVKGKDVTVSQEYKSEARANPLVEKDFRAGRSVFVLEAFSFARVIYDEFSYENFSVALFVKNAQAHAKWILSATPPTGNLKAVCDIGKLLNVHVARPVKLRPGLPLITEGPIVLRQSATEKQLAYEKLYTDKSVYERVNQGHKFLRHFASANPFDEEGLGKIKVTEKVYCSHLTRYEFVKYLDIQRDLQTSDLDITNLLKRHDLDSESLTDFPPEGKLRAGLALAYVASVNCIDDYESTDQLVANLTADLTAAKDRLTQIVNIAIWLIMRFFEENTAKKNESATSIVEDFVYDFQSIMDGNASAFGGVDGLRAVSEALFSGERFKGAAPTLRKISQNDKNPEPFFADLFGRLEPERLARSLVSYFQISDNNLSRLQDPEVADLIQKLSNEDASKLHSKEARRRLLRLVEDVERPDTPDRNEKVTSEAKGQPDYPRFDAVKRTRGATYTETESELIDAMLKYVEAKEEVTTRAKQVTSAENIFAWDNQRKCSVCEKSHRDLLLLPECGHFICPEHLEEGPTHCGHIITDKYPKGSGCSAIIQGRSISVNQIDRCSMESKYEDSLRVSSKSRNIFRTINEILQSGDDRILVFYQFDAQQQEICSLLEYHNIAFDTQPRSTRGRSSADKDSDKQRVRIMKLSSEEAAGSNFQDANHVLFLSTPVYGKQEDFERFVKQAKGRAVRHGQQKQVFVYYFVSINTFEVDLLQLRKKSDIQLEADNMAVFVPRSGTNGQTRREYNWSKRINVRPKREDMEVLTPKSTNGQTRPSDNGGRQSDIQPRTNIVVLIPRKADYDAGKRLDMQSLTKGQAISNSQKSVGEKTNGKVKSESKLDAALTDKLTSGLSEEEVWRLTDETNWLVQQNREF
ncbi:hypothetical protein GGR50DRAFT_340364 [Xylaria sp. CBS 124048]|nr:hypothetical protein GGR50DRAFT_340364 [Xylaria sp. CBS 124048]